MPLYLEEAVPHQKIPNPAPRELLGHYHEFLAIAPDRRTPGKINWHFRLRLRKPTIGTVLYSSSNSRMSDSKLSGLVPL